MPLIRSHPLTPAASIQAKDRAIMVSDFQFPRLGLVHVSGLCLLNMATSTTSLAMKQVRISQAMTDGEDDVRLKFNRNAAPSQPPGQERGSGAIDCDLWLPAADLYWSQR
ncbi:hypothetical protein N7470_004752 [Penicillium chermesinum]|nr:hypothetical protein N7470_004752 [Penicillium chermesinum]